MNSTFRRHNPLLVALLLIVIVTSVGYAVGYLWEIARDSSALTGAFVGLLVSLALTGFYLWRRTSGDDIEISSVNLSTPIGGGEVTLSVNRARRQVAWKLFVESTTRIATQRLDPNDGRLREALTSLKGLFDTVRGELKDMTPSPTPLEAHDQTVESFAVQLLNLGLRPCLARWHTRLQRWESRSLPENDWPLADLCRRDLEATRIKVVAFTRGLGMIANVAQLDTVLPPEPEGAPTDLVSDEELARREADAPEPA